MTDAAIDITHVQKVYRGGVRALDAGAMQVMRGEVFGLLGANGAGKSTLVKVLMTVVRPTQLEGAMLGAPVGHTATLARVGYLPEHHNFPGYLTGAQVIDFYAAMSGAPRRQRKARRGELLDLVGMTRWADRKLRTYSKGMRQRIGIAQALAHDPELVLLDEPTDGVDPVGRRDIRGILQRLKQDGKTVFLNSHMLSELEMVCDRVAILAGGKVVRQGALDELTAAGRRYEIELAGPVDAPDISLAAQRALGLPLSGSGGDMTGDTTGEPAAEVTTDPARRALLLPTAEAERVQPVIDALRAAGHTIVAVRPVRQSLEDLFMLAATEGDGAGGAGAEVRRRGRKGAK